MEVFKPGDIVTNGYDKKEYLILSTVETLMSNDKKTIVGIGYNVFRLDDNFSGIMVDYGQCVKIACMKDRPTGCFADNGGERAEENPEPRFKPGDKVKYEKGFNTYRIVRYKDEEKYYLAVCLDQKGRETYNLKEKSVFGKLMKVEDDDKENFLEKLLKGLEGKNINVNISIS